MNLFLLGFVLAVSPGPDFLLMSRNTLTHGRRSGYLTLAGNRVSLILHISFALLGLSVVLQQSALLFSSVKTLGAVYLIFLGVKSFLTKRQSRQHPAEPPGTSQDLSPGEAFRSGFLSNFLNPKVSLFFLSIFPQFTNPALLADHPFLVASIVFLGNSCWYVPVVFLIGYHRVRDALRRFQRSLDMVFGLLFIFFGVSMIWEEWTKAKQNLLQSTGSARSLSALPAHFGFSPSG